MNAKFIEMEIEFIFKNCKFYTVIGIIYIVWAI
jgi:hypothetical protein